MTRNLSTVTSVRAWLCCIALLFTWTTPSAADPQVLSGSRQILLLDAKGQRHPIGAIDFTPTHGNPQQVQYQLHLNHDRFTDHFLSMKEMKCLEGPELWCRIPYPYQNPMVVTASDLRWLEHDLLFLFKRNQEFGADFWNGIYYRLRLENGTLTGQGRAVDLNLLASPPEDLTVPPIGDHELYDLDLENRWLPRLLIE